MTKLDTQLVHGPAVNDNCTGAVTTPIYKATTFEYPKIGAPVTYDYSRSGNPTRQAVENQLATLEGGQRAFTFTSGMAAIHAALAIFKAGDHLIVGDQIYGGTFRLLYQFSPAGGLKSRRSTPATRKPLRPPSRTTPRQFTLKRLPTLCCR